MDQFDEVVLSELLKRMQPDERMIAFLINLTEAGVNTQVIQNIVDNAEFWIQQIRKLGYIVNYPTSSTATWKKLYFFFNQGLPTCKLLKSASEDLKFDSTVIEILLDSETRRYRILDKILYETIRRSSKYYPHHDINERIIKKILTDRYKSNDYAGDTRFGETYAQKALYVASAMGYDWIVERLLKDPKIRPRGPELSAAASGGHLSTFKMLLQDQRIGMADKCAAATILQVQHPELEKLLMDELGYS